MKNLLFIPYQDIYDFDTSGIMTREYSLLSLFLESNIENLYTIGKPRTLLDIKHYDKKNTFPNNSHEYILKEKINLSKQFRHVSYLNPDIIFRKRAWWVTGYNKLINKFKKEDIDFKNTIIYSNNPFSYGLLEYCHKKGATVVFDMMDNLYIHPSLSKNEREVALLGYTTIAKFADFFSCNSIAIKKFCRDSFGIDPILIKNGVFSPRTLDTLELPQYAELLSEQRKYKRTVGYIGKLGMRVNEDLIAEVSKKCSDTLFVFIGPHLKGQKNTKLINLFNTQKNILYLGPISSVYVYSFLNRFDVLSIPHAVGDRENGGDPLKLYQYLNTEKPIITTPILGVDEFKGFVKISNDNREWIEFLNEEKYKDLKYSTPKNIYWEDRANELLNFLHS